MSSSNDPHNQTVPITTHDELDEDELSMRPSLRPEEAAQLADFDRYMQQTMSDLSPQTSSGHSSSTTTASPINNFSRTRSEPSSPAATLSALIRQYPMYDRDTIAAVLSACKGDRAAAIAMLNQSSRSTASSMFSSLVSRVTNSNFSRSDAELAARLQQLENARVRPRRLNIPVRLDAPVLRQLVASLREIVVPALRAHFEELIFPDTRDDTGSLVYELRSLQVAALTLPSENVSVRSAVDCTTVLVNVVNANLVLEVGHWSYEGRGFVPLRDSGRATVSVNGLNIALRLEARRMNSGNIRIVIPQSDVTIDGVVRFKTHGAAADWAYNAMAIVFKPWVVSYIKEAVSGAVVRALAVHLRQWELATQLNASTSNAPPTQQASQPPVTASE